MDAIQDERLGELFEEAGALPIAAREAFIDEACQDDPVLRAELVTLLKARDEAPDYLEKMAGGLLTAAVAAFVQHSMEDLRPGQRIAQYEILEPIGSGGMGVVYKAYDQRLDRLVALKFLPPHLASKGMARARFTNEARAASALDHPNICTIYDIGELEGRPFLALACYDGETLKQKIARAPLTVNDSIDMMRQITEGVCAAHRRGIIHRDIKPSNVMVTREGVAKILDFGIAKVRDADAASAGTTLGTVAYMSPEQTRGLPVDARTDLWSIGVVAYEMLTGTRPFPGDSDPEILGAIRRDEPTPVVSLRPDVPALLASIVETCLSKDPASRYQRGEELLSELSAVESGVAAGDGGLGVRRLAVLPLAGSASDSDDAYFAVGVTDELIGRLSSVGGFHVIARASTMLFSKGGRSPEEIGRQLGVETILDANFSRSADRARINMRLLDPGSGQHFWSMDQEVSLNELAGAIRSIAWQVAGELDVQLHAGERRQLTKQGTDNVDAYTFYLKGRYFWNKRDRASTHQALDYFQQALDLDPTFAQAWTGLADAFSLLGSYFALPPEDAYPRARAAAEQALAIDDELAEAHASLATTLADHYWDWPAAGRHFRRALELNPSYATARLWYAGYFRDLGRYDEALAEVRKAQELDPLSPSSRIAEGITLYLARRYDDAIVSYQKLLAVTPGFTYADFLLALSYVQQTKYAEALDALHLVESSGSAPVDAPALTGFVYALLGRAGEARRMLAALDDLASRHYVSGFHRAVIHLALGEKDRALELLQQAVAARDKQVRLFRVEPLLDSIRPDPRFRALLKAVGLADADVAASVNAATAGR